jgi:hypothetical protein
MLKAASQGNMCEKLTQPGPIPDKVVILVFVTKALFVAGQKSGLSARGTSASFPEYHWMFSAQTCSVQLAGPNP